MCMHLFLRVGMCVCGYMYIRVCAGCFSAESNEVHKTSVIPCIKEIMFTFGNV